MENILLISLGILVAAVVGFFVGRHFSGGSVEKKRLAEELEAKQEELDAFRNKVSSHFEKTADLFNQVSDSYQSLYDHMASSSSQLCASPTFQGLPKGTTESAAAAAIVADSDSVKSETPKVEVNEEAVAESKPEEPKENQVFDANKLYNAHDYRNQEEDEKENALNDIDNVVDIESAKDDKNEPALDYAVKKEGVINHDSLNSDNTKAK